MRHHSPDLVDFQASFIRYILLDIRHAKNESGEGMEIGVPQWRDGFDVRVA
jgi:hypothetical protein